MTNPFGLSLEALEACAREPIHIPGSIQPNGVLLILTPADLIITQISMNCVDLIGYEPVQILGEPLSTIFPNSVINWIQTHISAEPPGSIALLDLVLSLHGADKQFHGMVHQYDGLVFLELLPIEHHLSNDNGDDLPLPEALAKPPGSDSGPPIYELLHQITKLTIQQADNSPLLVFCQAVAQEVHAITGYDRVMIYQFDDDGNGEVIAEARSTTLEPYLGLCYPAADIPPQARLLYLRSRVRALGDIYAPPVQIVPRVNPVTRRDPNLSYCLLRSFSPVHLEYMHNMGVRSTLTVSIIEQGRLWGLIACHHNQPRWPNQMIRAASDLLSEVISMQILLRTHALRAQALTRAQVAQHDLIRRMASRSDWFHALIDSDLNLAGMFEADGVAICRGDQIITTGITPTVADILRLITWLQTTVPARVLVTESLSSRNSSFAEIVPVASGLIAMEILRRDGYYVLWFRREVIQTITWGGNPTEKLSGSDGTARLHPRTSFAAWTTEMRGRSRPWPAASQHLAETLRGVMIEIVRELINAQQALATLDLLSIRRVVAASSEPIAITGPDGDLIFINQALAQLTGYTFAALRDAGGLAILPVRPNLASEIESAVRSAEGNWQGDIDLGTATGAIIPVHVQIDVILNEANTPIGQIRLYTDLRPRMHVEEERRRIDAQLLHAQKLESLGVLAGGIAHDFNNLLTVMIGHANLALLDLPEESPARKSIVQIELAAQRAASLSKQMLAYSGRGRFVVQPIDLNKMIIEMASLLQAAIGKTASLQLNLAKQLPAINADVTQIRQVVLSLITNASDAIGTHPGSITITTAEIFLNSNAMKQFITFETLPEGRYVSLDVTDTGQGMDPATLERIFEPFFTTRFTGRGLGLAAVQGILRGHRAILRVTSQVGAGTTFQVCFPIAQVETRVVEELAPPATPTVKGNNRLILVIDDDASVRTFIQRVLERGGFHVLTAEDGQSAVEVFMARHAEISAVLLDLTMPRMSGMEAFNALREIRPDVPVLLCSGYNEEDAITSFAGKGLAGFVQKPFRVQDLFATLGRVLPQQGQE